MAKAFSRNKKLNKIMKSIMKKKKKNIRIFMNVDNLKSYEVNISSENLIKSALNNANFLDNINSDTEKLYSLKNEYGYFYSLWCFFNTDYDLVIDLYKNYVDKKALDLFIKAKNGDKYSISCIIDVISVYYILRVYFNEEIQYHSNISAKIIKDILS